MSKQLFHNLRALVVAALLFGCAPSEEPAELCSIGHLRTLYKGYPRHIDEPLVIEGTVVSDDRYGQFSGRVAVQDNTGGIFIEVAHSDLYTLHKPGDKVRINCCGLTLGGYGGAAVLGEEDYGGWEVTPIKQGEWSRRYELVGTTPLPEASLRTIATLSAEDIASRVRLESLLIEEGGTSWGRVEEEGRKLHLIDSQRPTDTIVVWLGSCADYTSVLIPTGEVDVAGVLDYFGADYQIVIPSPSAILERAEK